MKMFFTFALLMLSVPALTPGGTAEAQSFSDPKILLALTDAFKKTFLKSKARYGEEEGEAFDVDSEREADHVAWDYVENEQVADRDAADDVDNEEEADRDAADDEDNEEEADRHASDDEEDTEVRGGKTTSKIPEEIVASLLGGNNKVHRPTPSG